jgi:hypothetical protein
LEELPKEIAKAVKYPHIREIEPDTRSLAEKYPHAREFEPEDTRSLAAKYPHAREEKPPSMLENIRFKEPAEGDKFGVQSLARTVERVVKAPKPEEEKEPPKLTGEQKHAAIEAAEKAAREAAFVGPPEPPGLGKGQEGIKEGVDGTNQLLTKIYDILKKQAEDAAKEGPSPVEKINTGDQFSD